MCVHLPPLMQRARDLFYALWVPDLFMRRVKSNEDWSLMCPNECPGLAETWGEEFERLYEQYEKEGRAKKVVKAQKLWFAILEAQTETGTPYMLYKDACNRKSNQQVPKLIPTLGWHWFVLSCANPYRAPPPVFLAGGESGNKASWVLLPCELDSCVTW